MHRFFIPKECFENDKVKITGEPLHQIGYVLRLKPADRIIVLDNSGREFEVEIEYLTKKESQGKILSKKTGKGEPAVKITLYQALLKADRFELALQKCVELGVTAIVPFISERCVVKNPSESKAERWQKIVREAAEQSERSVIPTLHPAVSFEEACRTVSRPALLLWEEENGKGLKQVLQNLPFKTAKAISLFIGPEGGFPESEVKLARKQGIAVASLGRRVLRSETAGLAAISAILYEKNEMDKKR
ncbi:MAG: 16S rRNA (uracil(1498)-N(3))-methyltransferase [Dehalococcoidales bacterium]|nr:16S rRNA (uracil(1498)-N(3))-methyltransferase [Dehalococcoidales bacterium]